MAQTWTCKEVISEPLDFSNRKYASQGWSSRPLKCYMVVWLVQPVADKEVVSEPIDLNPKHAFCFKDVKTCLFKRCLAFI